MLGLEVWGTACSAVGCLWCAMLHVGGRLITACVTLFSFKRALGPGGPGIKVRERQIQHAL
jgi:hypothetical protein